MNLLIRQLWVKNIIIFRNFHCPNKTYFNSEMSLYTLSFQIDTYDNDIAGNKINLIMNLPFWNIFLIIRFS